MGILEKIFGKKEKAPVNPPRIITMWEHNGWGNSIYFSNWEDRRIAGFMSPPPKVGDILRSKMESGKIARFEVIQIERMSDPSDQFFGTVNDLQYE